MDPRRSVLLLRHGETLWNAAGRLQGRGDSDLTDRGLREAQRLAEACAAHGVRRVVSSVLGRARVTAEHIAATCGASLEYSAELVELDFGRCSGLTRDEAVARFPRPQDPAERWHVPWPDGESYAEAAHRAHRWWCEQDSPWSDPPLAVVAHGAFLRSMRQALTGEPPEQALAMLLGRGLYWQVFEDGAVLTLTAPDGAGSEAARAAHP